MSNFASAENPRAEVLTLFPDADRFSKPYGVPPAIDVYSGDRLLGYVFETRDIAPIPAYSGRPVNTLVGVDPNGMIAGSVVLEHQEPILQAGVPEDALRRFADQYAGQRADVKIRVGAGSRAGVAYIDGITGATVTAMVINESIARSARAVWKSHADRNKEVSEAEGVSEVRAANSVTANSVPVAPVALWREIWHERAVSIVLLGAGLIVLALILILQDLLVQRPKLLMRLRTGFLLYTVLFIGSYALAQLSVINVLTFTSAIFHGFSWDTFLIDPLLFILWAFVAVSLLLWGRGVYCGWLCPFGAAQELINRLGRALKLRQLAVPFAVHERLWAIKYIILLGLFGVSLQSLKAAEYAAEVEPFKTAVTLHFQREWGYVIYAAGLLLVSLFNAKFYCRYFCPLGAALAIPAQIRVFDWLKRHKDCGSPCQICAHDCEVQAIHPNGVINANECHYCLDCQATYFNAHRCPPMVAKRKRRERAATARASVERIEKTLQTSTGLDDIGVRVEARKKKLKK